LGIITSYEDIKIGKIRNKWISLIVLISGILWFVLYFLDMVSLNYVFLIFVYGFAALIIGFFIWFIGLWSAGDAKLYFAFSLLIPLSSYQQGDFPAMVLLINSVVPIFLFLVGKMLIKSSRKQKLMVLKNVLQPKRLGKFMLVVFALAWIAQYLFFFMGIKQNYVFSIIAIMGLSMLLDKLFALDFFKKLKIQSLYVLVAIGILRIIFEYKFILTTTFWTGFFLLTLGYAIIRMFILDLGEIFSKSVNINKLQEGMVLAEIITKKGEKKKISGFGYSQMGQKDSLFELDSCGLSKKDIERIKRMKKQGRIIFNALRIESTIPFAPFICLGALLTVFLKGNVVFFMLGLFS
jgi:Flp pilus assembly protein protease CpaA